MFYNRDMTEATRTQAGPLGAIEVRPWPDELIERSGYGPESAYVELCWLPLLGPSATFAYRRLGRLAIDRPGIVLDPGEFFASLGLGRACASHSAGTRALDRLEAFGVARRSGDCLAVRRALPVLSSRQLAKVPASARAAHRAILASGSLAKSA